MKKVILSLIFISLSTSALSEGELTRSTKIYPVLVTTLIDLPSKCKITSFAGSATIGVRITGKSLDPVKVGDSVDQTKIIFMEKNTKIELLSEESTKLTLETKQNGETFTFSMRK